MKNEKKENMVIFFAEPVASVVTMFGVGNTQ